MATAELFLHLIKKPERINTKYLHTVEQVAHHYPYFQGAHILAAGGYYMLRGPGAKQKIAHASIYVTDKKAFKSFILRGAKRYSASRSASTPSVQTQRTITAPSVEEQALPKVDYHKDLMSNQERDVLVQEIFEQLEEVKRAKLHFEHAEELRKKREELDRQREKASAPKRKPRQKKKD